MGGGDGPGGILLTLEVRQLEWLATSCVKRYKPSATYSGYT